jgi:DNA-binding MarR family transcriptional regulator
MSVKPPVRAPSPDLVEMVLTLVPQVSRAISADVRQQKLSVPLTMGQFRTLEHIGAGYASPAMLAEHMVVSRPTMTRVVDALERRGLVIRSAVDGDRRSVRLELTDTGRAILREFRRKAARRVEHLLLQLSPREQDDLVGALRLLERALVASALGRGR